MVSEAKHQANQQNAKKSTGPKNTTQTRFNALKHGLYSGQMVIQGSVIHEDTSSFEDLLQALYNDKCPVGVLEEFLVDAIAGYTWKLRRVWRYESSAIANGMLDSWHGIKGPLNEEEKQDPYATIALRNPGKLIPDKATLERVTRSESLYYNSLTRSLRELERLQRGRLANISSSGSEVE